MKEEGTYYKKIVEYKRNKEDAIFLAMGFILIGFSLGWFLKIILFNPRDVSIILCTLITGIFLFIVNYFDTHDRNVKYERYKVCKK